MQTGNERSGMPTDVVEPRVDIVQPDALGIIQRTELETAMDFAQRYPRSIDRFLKNVRSLACQNKEIAESCTYTLPDRGQGPISGPSVRLAEIAFNFYQNLWGGTRLVNVGDDTLTAMGFLRDLENNTTVAVEVVRGIIYGQGSKQGQRFGADMIRVTAMAAMSIAFRNGVFRVIPQALIDQVWKETREVALDRAAGVEKRRDEAVAYFIARDVNYTRIFAALGVEGMQDIGWPQIEVLIGLANAVKTNEITLEEAFPIVPGNLKGTKGINLAQKPKPEASAGEPAAEPGASVPEPAPAPTAPQEPLPPEAAATTPAPEAEVKTRAPRKSRKPEAVDLGF